jgi:hypothetical protein
MTYYLLQQSRKNSEPRIQYSVENNIAKGVVTIAEMEQT